MTTHNCSCATALERREHQRNSACSENCVTHKQSYSHKPLMRKGCNQSRVLRLCPLLQKPTVRRVSKLSAAHQYSCRGLVFALPKQFAPLILFRQARIAWPSASVVPFGTCALVSGRRRGCTRMNTKINGRVNRRA